MYHLCVCLCVCVYVHVGVCVNIDIKIILQNYVLSIKMQLSPLH